MVNMSHGAVCNMQPFLFDPLNGGIRGEYHIGDGLHLNKAGNEGLLSGLRLCIETLRN